MAVETVSDSENGEVLAEMNALFTMEGERENAGTAVGASTRDDGEVEKEDDVTLF